MKHLKITGLRIRFFRRKVVGIFLSTVLFIGFCSFERIKNMCKLLLLTKVYNGVSVLRRPAYAGATSP